MARGTYWLSAEFHSLHPLFFFPPLYGRFLSPTLDATTTPRTDENEGDDLGGDGELTTLSLVFLPYTFMSDRIRGWNILQDINVGPTRR